MEFRAEDVGCAGTVAVVAQVSEGQIAALSIAAFGRTHIVPPEELKRIAGFPLAGVEITHEVGYEALGGYSVHLRLRRIANDEGRRIEQWAWITVTETKGPRPVVVRNVD